MSKSDIERDLKKAMLARDKSLVSILRSLKSAILYREVADGVRDQGIDELSLLAVLKKEKKSRMDALKMYQDAGEVPRAEEEAYQISIIEQYLPVQMSEEDTLSMVKEVIGDLKIEDISMKDMGQVMSAVKNKASNVDGGTLSKIVKDIISEG